MDTDETRQIFLEECDEQLALVEQVVLDLASGESEEAVNRCFRIFHTIKGGAGMVGFDQVARFTHNVETVLDKVRSKELPVTPELISVVLAAKDHIEALFAAENGGPTPAAELEAALLTRLTALSPAKAPSDGERRADVRRADDESTRPRHFSIRLESRPGRMVAPETITSLLLHLQSSGKCSIAFESAPLACWSIDLETHCPSSSLWARLGAVEDCLSVSLVESSESSGGVCLTSPDGGFAELFEVEAPQATVVEQPVPALPPPADQSTSRGKPGDADSTSAEAKPATAAKPVDSMVRVASSKLDLLVNLVSELVITQSRLAAVASRVGDPELAAPVEEVERLVGELREGVLGVRMMPIGSTFGRFKRLVHDLSSQLGKAVDLVTEGAETELDKSVLDQLVDPLLHLVRNSLDHGIEPTEARIAAGKPERGTVRLVAKHAGQHVVVTIQDDGKGLDAEAIRAKAIQRGLISADATLPQSELFKLIFLPGFSTAQALTSVSGRGVGMDVVKKQIEALRGSVRIHSERGVGTTMSLELPLTLAIIDGLLVEVGEDRYIMPLAAVTETVELPPDDRQKRNGNRVVVVREERVPYVSLRGVFTLPEEGVPNEKVVILETGEERIGLVVDRVLGGHQTVIQSLGPLYEHNAVVSGATIMGDGRVALILDVSGIVRVSRANDDSQGMILGRAA